MLRMGRILRLLNHFPELLVVIKGIWVACRAVGATCLLMLLICYVFAVTMRQITDGTELGRKYYPSVPRAMRYLLALGAVPDLVDPIITTCDAGFGYGLVFMIFTVLVAITVMNMLIG